MMQIVGLLLAIFKAVPVLKEVWEQLLSLYVKSQIDGMKKEMRDAIKKAIADFDQREIERIISQNPGDPSNLPGTELRPPRVRDEK